MGPREEGFDGTKARAFGKNDESLNVWSSGASNLIGEDEIFCNWSIVIQKLIVAGDRIADGKTPVGALWVNSDVLHAARYSL